MAQPPAGFAEFTIVMRMNGATRDSTFGCGIDDANFGLDSPEDIAINVATAFSDADSPGAAANMTGYWTFVGVSVTKMLEDGPISGQTTVNILGAAAGQPMPPNCSLLIQKSTSAGGRRNRGRMYPPPMWPIEGDVDFSGTIDSDEIANIQNWYSNFFDTLVATEYQPVLFHSEAPFTPTPITGFALQSRIATQRRRLRK